MSVKLIGGDELTHYETLHHQECKRMAGLRTIVKAWSKVVQGLTTDEDKRRSKICANCPHAEHRKLLNLVGDELKETKGMVCNLCGCPLSAKIRSTETCKRWEADIH